MAAAGLCTTLVTDYLSSFFISQTIGVFISHCVLARWSVCLSVVKQGVFMAVLQIAILFGVGSHVVTLYFGQNVKGRQRAGNLKAASPHL